MNFESKKDVFSFPNPSHGHVTIKTRMTSYDQSISVMVYNQIGKLKLNTLITNNETVDL
jgi:hypothetical protein